MTTHTPGPWEPNSGTASKRYVLSGAGYVIAEVPLDRNYKHQAEANARLIAAAPDLLEALEMAIRALQDHDIDESMAGEFEILTDAFARATKGT